MRSQVIKWVIGITLLCSVAVAQATSVTVGFPTATSTVVDSGVNPPGELGFFWSVSRGDMVGQSYGGTGLASVNHLDLHLDIDSVLLAGNSIDWNVLINGVSVGTWTRTAADGSGFADFSFDFADIAGGGTYLLQMFVTNEVPVNDGSIGFLLEGSTATFVGDIAAAPEPATFALLGIGLLGLGVSRRRKDGDHESTRAVRLPHLSL